MKKVLSIMLATMMVVSLFAINASAAVIESTYTVVEGAHPEYVYAEQDFSDVTANADFAEISYAGTASVADGEVSFTAESETSTTIGSLNSTKPITMGEFKVNFDIRRNDSLTSPTCLYVVVQRAANAESTDANLKKYGVCIPVAHLTTGAWYEYEVTFSEAAYLAANDVTKFGSVKYRAKGTESWTAIYHSGTWLPAASKFRSAGSTIFALDSSELSFHTREYNGMVGEEVATDINYSLDNIKAYTPENAGKEVVYDYPLVKGTTNLIYKDEVTMGAYAGGNANPGQYKYTTNMEALTEGQSRYIIYTFDAINTVKGMPICIHIGGAGMTYGFDILSTDEILNKWYTYKVVCREIFGNNNLSILAICRKPADGSGDWEVYNASFVSYLPSDEYSTAPVAGWWNNYDITSAKFHVRGSLSGTATNMIRLVWRGNAESLVDDDVTDLTATKWTFRNQQVVEGSLAVGEAKVEDGVLTVDADIATIDNAAPVLAIYDAENRMVDVDFTAFASGTGELLLSADYADGNTAKIFVWEGTEGPEIPTSIVWDITDSITK